jgi:hypothetical protein
MDMNFFRTSKIKKVATTWVFTTFLGNTIMTTKPRYNRTILAANVQCIQNNVSTCFVNKRSQNHIILVTPNILT